MKYAWLYTGALVHLPPPRRRHRSGRAGSRSSAPPLPLLTPQHLRPLSCSSSGSGVVSVRMVVVQQDAGVVVSALSPASSLASSCHVPNPRRAVPSAHTRPGSDGGGIVTRRTPLHALLLRLAFRDHFRAARSDVFPPRILVPCPRSGSMFSTLRLGSIYPVIHVAPPCKCHFPVGLSASFSLRLHRPPGAPSPATMCPEYSAQVAAWTEERRGRRGGHEEQPSVRFSRFASVLPSFDASSESDYWRFYSCPLDWNPGKMRLPTSKITALIMMPP
jgi:hypothetical protein